eukprot:CAMPEP_0114430790 /NCGR_PEP_ID=MMETSP0103-20121206/10232_1 /TAXON_ID=37642 ORGANISM="Paraphysomonas imperforata, Strain PA2" /NCGR_SAMPLE_ID=MMETSP0103 /ASSEMBLY_ACC=CAM_ASM_000201 /LENGTH=264 /DNA_ID=CAMNT_0001600267 /DNA_START=139 /DNA_END=929 /DNA_ORIENTATION=+
MTTPGAASRAQSPRQEHLVSMFGESLYHWAPAAEGNEKISQVDTLAALRTNKTLGVYFSGSWCGPCQAFTPKLAKFYEVLKKKSQEFEVVWISHDHSSDDFVRYFQQMPWLALAADRVAVQGARLAEQFGVQGIPALVLLDASDPHGACSVIALDGVDKVSRDPYALEFPYKPRLSALKAASTQEAAQFRLKEEGFRCGAIQGGIQRSGQSSVAVKYSAAHSAGAQGCSGSSYFFGVPKVYLIKGNTRQGPVDLLAEARQERLT